MTDLENTINAIRDRVTHYDDGLLAADKCMEAIVEIVQKRLIQVQRELMSTSETVGQQARRLK